MKTDLLPSLGKEDSPLDVEPQAGFEESYFAMVNRMINERYPGFDGHGVVKGSCGHTIQRCKCPSWDVEQHIDMILDTPCKKCWGPETLSKKASLLDPRSKKRVESFLLSPSGDSFIETAAKIRNRKERRKPKFPVLMAAMAAGGLGLNRLGEWIISEKDANKVRELLAMRHMVDPETGKPVAAWDGTTDFYTQYLDRAGRAAQAKLFGTISARDALVGYRKHIEPLVGGAYPIRTQYDLDNAVEHYDTFASGPAHALLHQLKVMAHLDSRLGEEDKRLLLERATTGLASHVAATQKTDEAEALRDLTDLKTPLASDRYPFGGQLDAVRSYLGSFRPGSWEDTTLRPYIRSISEGNAKSALGYSGIDPVLKAIHTIPKNLGLAAGSLGLGLVGAWGVTSLYERLKKKDREKQDAADLRTALTTSLNDWQQNIPLVDAQRIVGRKLKTASVGKLLRFAAKVPEGQKFFPSFGVGTGRLARLALAPNLGRRGNLLRGLVTATAGGHAGVSAVKSWLELTEAFRPLLQRLGLSPESVTAGSVADAYLGTNFLIPEGREKQLQPPLRAGVEALAREWAARTWNRVKTIHPSEWGSGSLEPVAASRYPSG